MGWDETINNFHIFGGRFKTTNQSINSNSNSKFQFQIQSHPIQSINQSINQKLIWQFEYGLSTSKWGNYPQHTLVIPGQKILGNIFWLWDGVGSTPNKSMVFWLLLLGLATFWWCIGIIQSGRYGFGDVSQDRQSLEVPKMVGLSPSSHGTPKSSRDWKPSFWGCLIFGNLHLSPIYIQFIASFFFLWLASLEKIRGLGKVQGQPKQKIRICASLSSSCRMHSSWHITSRSFLSKSQKKKTTIFCIGWSTMVSKTRFPEDCGTSKSVLPNRTITSHLMFFHLVPNIHIQSLLFHPHLGGFSPSILGWAQATARLPGAALSLKSWRGVRRSVLRVECGELKVGILTQGTESTPSTLCTCSCLCHLDDVESTWQVGSRRWLSYYMD